MSAEATPMRLLLHSWSGVQHARLGRPAAKPHNRVGDRYELTYPISRHGMGEVWAGYDERLDRSVAIQFLRQLDVPPEERDDAVRRFKREARVAARIDHPALPVVHDLGVHGDDLYLVLQLIPGTTLADLVTERAPVPVAQAVSIAARICSVLAAAHAALLVHRNLQPENVVIMPTGLVKVLDFGVSALLGPARLARLVASGRVLGTPAYLAPEQALDLVVGPSADLYALGCILFELLAGRPPYQARTAIDLLRRILEDPVPVVTDQRPEVPEELAHIIFCLLAKNPQERPQSAVQVLQLLAPFGPVHQDGFERGAR